jgi:hypothetical protein
MSRTEDLSWSLVIRSYEGKIIGSQKSLAFIGIGESLLCLVQTGNIAAAKGFFPSLASHVFENGAGLARPECGLIYCYNK